MTPLVPLVAAGFVSWTVSTLSAGGGSVLFVALLNIFLSSRAVAPLVAVASLIAAPLRMAMFWRDIDWRVVRWYAPGGMLGAALGGWLLTRLPVAWLDLIVAAFLISTAWQYRFGRQERSFRMTLTGFLPLSFVVGLLSAMIGASGLIASPFYLNYGLIKESLLATRAANSLAIQITKIVVYSWLGVLNLGLVQDGLIAGIGAGAAVLLSRPLLNRINGRQFRQYAIVMMVATGLYMIWRRRSLIALLFA